MEVTTDFQSHLMQCGFTNREAEQVTSLRVANPKREFGRNVAVNKAGSVAELLVYDVIGFDFWTGEGVTPQRIVDQLEAAKPFDSIVMRINSPGGNVFDATTILNILRRQSVPIDVDIDGIAASAASYLSQIADKGKLRISVAAQMMIHQAQIGLGVIGDANVIESAAAEVVSVLRKIDGQIADIYASRSGRKQATFLQMMAKTSYFTGKEAVEERLADATFGTSREASNVASITEMSGDSAKLPLNDAKAKAMRSRLVEVEAGR